MVERLLKQPLSTCKGARATSSQRPVLSGVPQRSILGPILFVYFVDDINTLKLSKGASLTMYADICYSQSVLDQSTFQDIQHDIDKIMQWAENNKLTFNESKTVWILLSKKSHSQFTNAELSLSGKRLDRVNEVDYLGVTLSSDLAWSAHFQFLVSNAKRKLSYMFRTFYKQCSTEVLLNLYKHLNGPTLEYCCSVWDPSSKSLIVELEKTQKLAARICLKTGHLHMKSC